MFGLNPLKDLDLTFRHKSLDLQSLSLLCPPQGLIDFSLFGLLGRPLHSLHQNPKPRLRLLPSPIISLQDLLLPSPRPSLDYTPLLRLGLQHPSKLRLNLPLALISNLYASALSVRG